MDFVYFSLKSHIEYLFIYLYWSSAELLWENVYLAYFIYSFIRSFIFAIDLTRGLNEKGPYRPIYLNTGPLVFGTVLRRLKRYELVRGGVALRKEGL